MTITKGLNFYGTCQTPECVAYNQRVIIKKGLGVFHIAFEQYNSNCPKCDKRAKDVNNMGFYKCFYDIDGV